MIWDFFVFNRSQHQGPGFFKDLIVQYRVLLFLFVPDSSPIGLLFGTEVV